MFQVIEGKSCYVVEFDTMPELPITGLTVEERTYQGILAYAQALAGGWVDRAMNGLYARALTHAIETGVITEPGKYAIHIENSTTVAYAIYRVDEQ